MYQRCFDSAAETIFEQDKTPRFSRFVISDDPNWESGHHMHDNETELIYVKKGIARLIIDSSLYVAHVWGGDQFRTEFVHLKSACSP